MVESGFWMVFRRPPIAIVSLLFVPSYDFLVWSSRERLGAGSVGLRGDFSLKTCWLRSGMRGELAA